MLLTIFLLVGAVSFSKQQMTSSDSNGGKRIACYMPNWSREREGKYNFTAANVDPFLCTHLMYAFAKINNDEPIIVPTNKLADIDYGGWRSFTSLKEQNKDLKTMISVGGWAEGPARFSVLTASNEKRVQFVENTIKFLRDYNFDGVDFDWQYPNDDSRIGSSINDRANYVLLIKEMREGFEAEANRTGKPRLILSMVLPSKLDIVDKGYDIPILNRYVDHFNLVAYDYHLASEPFVQHHTPLFSIKGGESDEPFESVLNVDYSVSTLLKRGVTPSKLNLGIPTYGRLFTLEDPNETEIGALALGGGVGNTTVEIGVKVYYETCRDINKDSWKVEYMNAKTPMEGAFGPYAFKGSLWVCYDDPVSVKTKGKYARDMGLGGLMFWTIDYDDFTGDCYGTQFPVIKAGKEAISSGERIIDSMKPKSSRRMITKIIKKVEPDSPTPSKTPLDTSGEQVEQVTSTTARANTRRTTAKPPSRANSEIIRPAASSSRNTISSNADSEFVSSDQYFDTPSSNKRNPSWLALLFPNNVFFQDRVLVSYNVHINKRDNKR